MKKVLSLVLVIAMVLSSMSFAFAGTFTDVEGDYEKAIEMLVALGIVDGYEDGTYRPERVVTRAEMAKLMVVALGYSDLVTGSKSNFSDTQGHWADAYIALAAGKGIVIGDGDGRFRPDSTVSYDEAITMLVRGLGYTDNCNELKGMTWPTNFKVKAADLKITKDVKLTSTGADRGGVAQLIANALEATLVTVTVDGDVTLLQDTVDGEKIDRILLTRVATPDYDYDVTPERLDSSNKNYGGKIVDLGEYMFQNLKVFLNDDDEVVYVKSSNSLVIEGTYDDFDEDSEVLSIEDANEKIKKAALEDKDIDSSVVFENGAIKETDIEAKDLEDTDSIKIVAKDANKNGKIDEKEVVGFVTTIQTGVIRVQQEYVAGKAKLEGLLLPTDDDDKVDLANITVKGDATSLEDIEEDDIVAEYLSEDETVTTLVVTRDTVEGKVTRIDDDTYYIDGKDYDLAGKALITDLELGNEGVFFLDHNGELVDFDGSGVGPTNYAVVLGVEEGTVTEKFGKTSVDDYPQVKLATQDDETVVLDIYVKIDSAGEVTNSAKIGSDNIVTVYEEGEDTKLAIDSRLDENVLIKYSLNKDGKINKVTIVRNLEAANTFANVDLEKSTNKLAADVVVFDQTEDYDVVDADVLPSDLDAYVVRNSSGQIIVLVAKYGEISEKAKTSFVFITKVNESSNADDEIVQTVVAYTDGAKKTIVTTADDTVDYDGHAVYKVKYDGELLDEATEQTRAAVTTASSINAREGMVKIGEDWLAMSDHGTVIGVKGTTVKVRDLFDITKGVTEFEYYATEGEIDLIIIHEK